jgi:hypothetical protein
VAAAGLLLVLAQTALSAPSRPDVASRPSGATTAGSATFVWRASQPDPGATIVRYEGGLDGAVANLGPSPGSVEMALTEGDHTFRVRAVQQILEPIGPEVPGPFGSARVIVDRTAPQISVRLSPSSPNGDNGWYRSLTVDWSCSDPGGSGIEACPPDEAVGTQGAGQRRQGRARDRAGNVSGLATSPTFNFDAARPNAGPMRSPSPGAIVAAEPTFVWGPATGGETSGFNRYEVMVRISGTYRPVARVAHRAGTPQYSSARDPRVYASPLPKDTDLRWYVRTYDNAGNAGGGESQSRAFRIDSTVPGPPAITGGPSGPTNVAAPTFTWNGNQPSYAWSVSVGGTETSLVSGSGPQKQASLPALPDGDYTFAVSQVTGPGARGAEATREFQVDTVAPPAPVITARPPFPTASPSPSFAWTTEAGAYSRWRVIAPGGGSLQSSDTPLTSATVGPFANGAYNFRVTQVDPAGNESAPALEPFSIAGAVTPARRTPLALPRQNAGRLRPKAGALLLTRRPILRWLAGPRGTSLYNLQVFRVSKTRTVGRATPAVRKIYSVFPKARRYKMPKVKILPGTCYVWRVWPFVGNKFTGTPLGVSNFCIASKKRLRQEALADARRRAARGR